MTEATAVEDMVRPFFQWLLMDRDIPPTRHLCPELSMAPAFLDALTFCFCHLFYRCAKLQRRNKARSLGFGRIHLSSPCLSPHFLEAGTVGENEDLRQTTQPV